MAIVCQTCGDIGFEEALISCDSCKIQFVHRYCMGTTPVPLTEDIQWFCEDCGGSDSGFDPEGDDEDPSENNTDYDGNDSDSSDYEDESEDSDSSDSEEEPEAKYMGIGWRSQQGR